jgi:hypothetical protein
MPTHPNRVAVRVLLDGGDPGAGVVGARPDGPLGDALGALWSIRGEGEGEEEGDHDASLLSACTRSRHRKYRLVFNSTGFMVDLRFPLIDSMPIAPPGVILGERSAIFMELLLF